MPTYAKDTNVGERLIPPLRRVKKFATRPLQTIRILQETLSCTKRPCTQSIGALTGAAVLRISLEWW